MRLILSGNNMIVWKETTPDFRRKLIGDLLSALPFTLACAVICHDRRSPRVIARRAVLDEIWKHLAEQRVEMGGLLIGTVYGLENDEARFVVSIEDFARGDEFKGTEVSLRLGTSVWEAASSKSKDRQSVIGWYHSHPNLGAFFSGTDRRTQAAFFKEPHCLGLVIDPIRREEKWFLGAQSEQIEAFHILRVG